MKNYICALFLFLGLVCIAQESPVFDLQYKWINESKNYGIEIHSDLIILLKGKPDWKTSDLVQDKYYFIGKPLANEQNLFVTWLYNDVLFDVFKNGKTVKVQGKQYRMFKLQLNDEGILEVSISEKILEYEKRPISLWSPEADAFFVKKIALKRFIPEKTYQTNQHDH
ncbi:hypothetical protein [Flavobacterium caeni]|uniref:DUF4488 domain-containing protein n=1 Tax=Flavobacterium caeni TaxID=490189 RepID=A0A1G5KJB7_9FLAO|nr:hypothetical protein [Flavobacterium caeni]SCZ00039.1 hypothetical protein SAMN02927903_03312 [Flavobacterium caeni]